MTIGATTMNQTKLQSAAEAALNVAVGMGVALGSQLVVFPLVGIPEQEMSVHLMITFYFTLISLARSYIIRRWFNGLKFTKQNVQEQTGA